MARILFTLVIVCVLLCGCGNNSPSSPPNNTPPALGKLSLTIDGLPGNVQAEVNITGPDSYDQDLIHSIIIESLPIGQYTVTAKRVIDSNSDTLTPAPITQVVTIIQNKTTEVHVGYDYNHRYGSLDITVNGVPLEQDANITLTGPGGYSSSIIASTIFDSLRVGTYTITASPIALNSLDSLFASPLIQSIVIEENQTKHAIVDYSAPNNFGSVSITITGLPDGEDGYARFSKVGDANYTDISQSIVIGSLEAGNYLLTAFGVVTSQNVTYIPEIESQMIAVTGGFTTNVEVVYKEKYGELQINITGLPDENDAYIKFYKEGADPSWDYIDVYGPRLLDSLEDGFYKLDIFEVISSDDGVIYRPENDWERVQVIAGQTSTITINYSEKFGKISVTFSGLPVGTDGEALISQIQGNNSYLVTLPVILDSLDEMDYSVHTTPVSIPNENDYDPVKEFDTISVVGGATTSYVVAYKAKYGSIRVIVDGLNIGDLADIQVKDRSKPEIHLVSETDVIHKLDSGLFDIIAAPIFSTSGDSLYPTIDSQEVEVIPGQELEVQVTYEFGYTFRVYADPDHPRQLIRFRDLCDSVQDVQEFLSDTVSGHSAGHMYGGCTIVNNDITNTGITKFYEIVGAFCSGSISEEITVDRSQSKLTIARAIEAMTIVPTCSSVGASAMTISSESIEHGSPLMIEIGNPFNDTILIHISGTGDAFREYTVPVIDNLGSRCNSSFGFTHSTCSYPNPGLTIIPLPGLSLAAPFNWDWDPTMTDVMDQADTVIFVSTEPFLSFNFYKPAYGNTQARYVVNSVSASSMFVLSYDITIWVERRKVAR